MANSQEIAQINEINKGLTALNDTLSKTSTSYLTLVKTISDSSDTVKNSAISYENLEKAQKQTAENSKQLDTIGKSLIQSEEKLKQVEDKRLETIIRNRAETQKATKDIQLKIKAQQAEKGSIDQLIAVNSILEKRLKSVNLATDEGRKKADLLRSAIDKNNASIKTNSSALSAQKINIGNYRGALDDLKQGVLNGTASFGTFKTAIMAMGRASMAFLMTPIGMITAAIAAFVLAGKALITNSREFQKASSSLSAITGATGESLKFMTDKAKEYSKALGLSATEIVGAFEKVGSAIPELLNNGEMLTEVTKNALVLSQSTGGKLAIEDAAKAAATALNQFGIPLTESARAVNVLAAGSKAGSAEVLDLTESFKNVGAVASTSNMTLEETTAALETLGEKGLYGAEAGTKLRGVLLQMKAAGMGFASGQFNINDALEETRVKLDGIKDPIKRAAMEQEIFGKENMTAGIILTQNIGKFNELTKAVTGTNTAFEQAATQTDNLDGSYNRFSTAWKGLLLTLEDGNGIVMKVWRGLVDYVTWWIDLYDKAFKKAGAILDFFRSKEKIAANEKEKEAMQAAETAKVVEEQKAKAAEQEKQRIEGLAALEKTKSEERAAENEKAAKKAEKIREEKERKDKEAAKIVQEQEKLKVEAIMKTLEAQNDVIDSMMKDQSDFEKIYQDQIDIILESDQKEFDNWYDLQEEKKKKREEDAKDEKERHKELRDLQIDVARQAVDALFEINAAKFEKEMQSLEIEKNAKLANKNLTEAQKVKIEEDYQKKVNAVKEKQAKNEKMQALFKIALETAIGAAKAVAESPLTFGMPFLPWVIAQGVIQAAIVASQPVPKFAKGTDNAPSKGLFGEAGRELMFLKSGEVMMADRPTYFSGSKFKGAQIISNPETESMIKQAGASGMSGRGMNDNRIVSELRGVKNAIKSIPSPIVDKDYKQIGVKTSRHQEIYLNRLTRN